MHGVNLNRGDFSLQLCLALFLTAEAGWCMKQTEFRAGRVCLCSSELPWPGWAYSRPCLYEWSCFSTRNSAGIARGGRTQTNSPARNPPSTPGCISQARLDLPPSWIVQQSITLLKSSAPCLAVKHWGCSPRLSSFSNIEVSTE